MKTLNLNARLFKLFKRNFKNDLCYYNNSGIIYYLCQNFNLLNNKTINQIQYNDLYLKDFKRNINFSPNTITLSRLHIKNEELKFIDKVIKLLNNKIEEYNTNIIDANNNSNKIQFNKIYRATAINYIIFHLLIDNSILELRENNYCNLNENYNNSNLDLNSNIEYIDEENNDPTEKRIYLE